MCSHNFAPTSAGPGIADLPCVAVSPISLAHSGPILATGPVERGPTCHMAIKAANSTTETIAARKRRERVIAPSPSDPEARSRRLPDLEARQIFLRLGRVEGLAHHGKTLRRRRGRRQPRFLHQLGRIGGEI